MPEPTPPQVAAYLARGWPVVPVYIERLPNGKKKSRWVVDGGFNSASANHVQVEEWAIDYPDCSWAIATGPKSIMVVDVDLAGVDAWNALVEKHGDPGTLEVQTQSGGKHLYFLWPPGQHEIGSRAGVPAEGIDIRGSGGCAFAPPSDGYKFLTEVDPVVAPRWLIRAVSKAPTKKHEISRDGPVPEGQRHTYIINESTTLARMGKSADEIISMLRGVLDNDALVAAGDHPVSDAELSSAAESAITKYGRSAPLSFTDEELKSVLGDLPSPVTAWIAQQAPSIDDYVRALDEAGLVLRRSALDGSLLLRKARLTDSKFDVIRMILHKAGYKQEALLETAISNAASRHYFNPILDWWESAPWDGVPHIHALAEFFNDRHDMFDVWLRRWCIGSVARMLAKGVGTQNRMLTLESRQGMGKSYFSRWLVGPMVEYYREGGINPDDKDARLRMGNVWINEVGELGATFRKSDRDALKFFLTMQVVRERRPYAHYDTQVIARTSFIGTLNSEGGFLTDPTGNRRYVIASFKNIDWEYAKSIDPQQIWAEALAAYRDGESWELLPDEAEIADRINEEYETVDPLVEDLRRLFEFDSGNRDIHKFGGYPHGYRSEAARAGAGADYASTCGEGDNEAGRRCRQVGPRNTGVFWGEKAPLDMPGDSEIENFFRCAENIWRQRETVFHIDTTVDVRIIPSMCLPVSPTA